MSGNPDHEVEDTMNRINKIFFGYSCFSLGASYFINSVWKTYPIQKALILIPSSLAFSAFLTWLHIHKSFTSKEKAILSEEIEKKYNQFNKSNKK
ncbi:unnamed protein product [Blepharisma stoltei]|uniref:Uncharacterized protein n=1 Tax=Blepharisma stoltei TaxID=1481888 RepID=A0AAU9IXL2_9CILI|nr:unnamed protein product [Blepharisma stoltei]